MHRTTIMLPLDLKRRAQRLAGQMGVSLGELIREALEATLRGHGGDVREDSLFADTASHDGPVPADLSEGHDRYLYGDGGAGGS